MGPKAARRRVVVRAPDREGIEQWWRETGIKGWRNLGEEEKAYLPDKVRLVRTTGRDLGSSIKSAGDSRSRKEKEKAEEEAGAKGR